jgi:hypothetical protein
MWIVCRRVILDRFAACWEELDDPLIGNAGLHDFIELMISPCADLFEKSNRRRSQAKKQPIQQNSGVSNLQD